MTCASNGSYSSRTISRFGAVFTVRPESVHLLTADKTDIMSIVAVTGSSGKVGKRLIERLAREDSIGSILAIDITPPARQLPDKVEFCHLDIRNRLLEEVLATKRVETVIHLAFAVVPIHNSFEMHEINLVSSMNLFSACSKINIKNLVIISSSFVYGFHPDNSFYMTEDQPLRPNRKFQYQVDKKELEDFANRFDRRHPETRLTILRPAAVPGSRMAYYIQRYFKRDVTPTLFGYDPLLQLLHMEDFIEAVIRAVRDKHAGTFNVAADGIISLSALAKLLGTFTLPLAHPLAYPAADLLWYLKLSSGRSDILALLRHSCLVSTKKQIESFGVRPVKSTTETATEWGASGLSGPAQKKAGQESYSLQQLLKTFQDEFEKEGKERLLRFLRRASQGMNRGLETKR